MQEAISSSIRVILIAATGVLLTHCAQPSTPPSPEPGLNGDEWSVDSIDGQDLVELSHLTLVFDDTGALTGSSGCNQFSASYDLSGDALSIGPMTITERACIAPVMEQESRFVDILSNAARVDFPEDGALIISTSNERAITARR